MNSMRETRKRNLLTKRRILSERRAMERFLADKTSFNNYLKEKIREYADLPAITDEYVNASVNYKEFEDTCSNLAAAIQSFGIKKGDFVAIFSENHGKWAMCEQAAMRCGAVCTLRGSAAPPEELDYILTHSEAKGLIIRDGRTLKRLKEYLPNHNLNFILIMIKSDKDDITGFNCPVYYMEEAIELGKTKEFTAVEQNIDDYAVMMYTSGTTGNPKGVPQTHKNILSQMEALEYSLKSKKGENTLQILPVWHAYEHIGQLYFFTCGCHLHFTTLPGLKNDLAKYKIDMMMSVPRIWEAIRLGIFQKLKQKSPFTYWLFDFGVQVSILYKVHKMYSEKRITNKKGSYNKFNNFYHRFVRTFLKPIHLLFTYKLYSKIKENAGINFRASISGGGALAMKEQLFYDAIGVDLREGYGLTETTPILTLRYLDGPNFLGCCGKPLMATEIKILDIETGQELGIFKKGIVYVRGYQVTGGYYKNEEATKAVFSEDGWFNTGDIGWLTADNNLVLVGRIKETIVLSNGENVEPIPIEEACLESPYIDQIVLVGQDKSSIGALVVPSEEALKKCRLLAKDMKSGKNLSIKDKSLRDLIRSEIEANIKNKKSLKSFENIKQFEVLSENFSTDNGMMSQTSKIKRNKVFEKYKATIESMFEKK
ncbi:AMP-binding protein [bacterium]|nr:AMP-binding protein [bacterium]